MSRRAALPYRVAASVLTGASAGERGYRRRILSFPRGITAMRDRNRREFLADVGRGMLIASVGPALACDLGLASARTDQAPEALSFGKLEPLVGLMQDTPANKLL